MKKFILMIAFIGFAISMNANRIVNACYVNEAKELSRVQLLINDQLEVIGYIRGRECVYLKKHSSSEELSNEAYESEDITNTYNRKSNLLGHTVYFCV